MPARHGEKEGFHDLGRHVCRSDQVQVVAPHPLDGKEDSCKSFGGHLVALSLVADPVVLAEGAHEIATGEENGPRAVAPNEGGFLAEMGTHGRHRDTPPDTAETLCPRFPVHPAMPWADIALRKPAHEPLRPFCQNGDVRKNDQLSLPGAATGIVPPPVPNPVPHADGIPW
jgi:hypothetical protein